MGDRNVENATGEDGMKNGGKREEESRDTKIRVINLGIETFYQALADQGVKTTQIRWHPPVRQDEEIQSLLDEFL